MIRNSQCQTFDHSPKCCNERVSSSHVVRAQWKTPMDPILPSEVTSQVLVTCDVAFVNSWQSMAANRNLCD